MVKTAGAVLGARERLANEFRELASLPCLFDHDTARVSALARALDVKIVVERVSFDNYMDVKKLQGKEMIFNDKTRDVHV